MEEESITASGRTWLRRVVAGLPPGGLGFRSKPGHVRFVAGKATVELIFI